MTRRLERLAPERLRGVDDELGPWVVVDGERLYTDPMRYERREQRRTPESDERRAAKAEWLRSGRAAFETQRDRVGSAMREIRVRLWSMLDGEQRSRLESLYWVFAARRYGERRAEWYRQEYEWLRGERRRRLEAMRDRPALGAFRKGTQS